MRDITNYLFRVGNTIFPAVFGAVLILSVNTVRAQEATPRSLPEVSVGATADKGDEEALRKNVQQLTEEVQRLKKRLAEVQRDRQQEGLRDRLTKEELRAESLQSRLTEIGEKQATLQNRLLVVEQQSIPENLDRMLAGYGSTHPEEVRDAIRKQLVLERQGIQSQLEILRQEQNRLQDSLARTDAVIAQLRLQLNEVLAQNEF